MSFNGLKKGVRSAVSRSVPLTIAAFVADDLLARSGLADANPAPAGHLSGADVEADVAYARSVASQYVANGVDHGRVAEIGPGGSAATALLLRSAGAVQVDLLDRFAFPHDPRRLAETYRRIAAEEPALRNVLGAADRIEGVDFHVGENAAAERFFASRARQFDAVCSCAVLEHVTDPLLVLRSATKALKAGGRQVHFVDFRDHGMFTLGGHHPLTFLTVPDAVYRHMAQRRGRPNRVLVDQYRAVLAELPLEWEIKVTSLLGTGPVPPAAYESLDAGARARGEAMAGEIADRLAPRYRSLAPRDLAVEGIAITATKVGT